MTASLPAPGHSVLVMAKAPLPGTVKTRLHPLLGPGGCAALQSALIGQVSRLATGQGASTFVAFDPPGAHDALRALVPDEVHLIPQRTGHLGDRLVGAVRDVFAAGAGPVVVLGVDAPTLTPRHLDAAFAALSKPIDGPDAVLGPALDGGYYLLGLRRPHLELFDIDPRLWGGSGVLAATLELAGRHGLGMSQLPVLRDLDTPEDARVLLTDPQLPACVAALLTPGGDDR